MFREMLRARQQLTREECLEILKREKRGVLSVLGDDGYPYGIPLDHYYREEDGRLYFHCGRAGHKLDALRRCPKTSFCVLEESGPEPGDWALRFRSVVVFGRVKFIEDPETICGIAAALSRKFTDDEAYIAEEIRRFGPVTCMFALVPEHMTGKRVRES